MKNIYKLCFFNFKILTFGILLFSVGGFAQTPIKWIGVSGGTWATGANWQGGTKPSNTQVAVFENFNGIILNGNSDETIGGLSIVGSNFTLQQNTNNSRSINIGNGLSGIDLQVINSNVTILGRVGNNSTLTLNLVNGNTSLISNSNIITQSTDGTVSRAGILTNSAPASNLTFDATSIYIHNVNGGTIPTATWQAGSTCSLTGVTSTAPTGMAQRFADFAYNCNHASATPTNQNLTVVGTFYMQNTGTATLRMFNSGSGGFWDINNYVQTGGRLNFGDGTNQVLRIRGNFTQTSGEILSANSTTAGLQFAGSANQNFAYSSLALSNQVFALEIINTGTLGNNNIILQNDLILTNLLPVLNFVSGNIQTGTNRVVVTATGTSITNSSSSTGWIVGNLVKPFAAGTNVARTFEIGTSSNYTPVAITFPTVATAGSLLVTSNAGDASAIGSSELNAAKSINNNWVITTPSGASAPLPLSYNATFTYPTGLKDVSIDDSRLVLGLYDGSAWSYLSQTSTTSNSTTFNSINSINNFQISETLEATDLFSYQNGNWNNPNTWTEDPSGTILINPRVPSFFNKVTLLNGRTVSLSANVTTNGINLIINLGSTFDLKTFAMNSLTGLSGQGIIRLNSTNLPAVNGPNTFYNAGQGTIDYYNLTTTLPTSATVYNNLWLTKDDNVATNYVYTLGSNLMLNGDLRIRNLQNIGTSTLSVGNSTTVRNITIAGNLIVGDVAGGATNAVLSVSGFNAQHTANLFGDLLNYGTVDLSNGTQYTSNAVDQSMSLTFRGSTNNQFFCDGPTEILSMTVNKGTDQTYILSLSATAHNYFKFMLDGKGLDIDMGTLKLGNNIVLDRLVPSGNYDIGTGVQSIKNAGIDNNGCAFWIDGAIIYNASLQNGGGAIVPYGKFRITNGAITVSGAGIVPRMDGEIFIEGGYVNAAKIRTSVVSGAIPRGTFFMSGGILDLNRPDLNLKEAIGDHAPFTYPFVDASYIVSGGTINVFSVGTNNALFIVNSTAQNINVTGGTVNFSISGSTVQNNISSTAPFHDLNIYKLPATGNRVIALTNQVLGANYTSPGFTPSIPARPLVVKNKLYIDGINAPILSLAGQELYINKDLEIATGGSLNPTASNVYFNGTGSQSVLLNGSVSGIVGALNFSNTSSTPIFLQGSLATITVNSLNINSGVVNDGGKTIRVIGNILNSGFHRGNGKVELVGTTTQNINGNGSGIFGNIDLNNTDAGVDGAVLNTNITIRNSLRLVSDKIFNIGTYKLTLDSNVTQNCIITTIGTGFGASKFIKTAGNQSDGGLSLFALNNATQLFYPMGTGTNYTPITATLSGISNSLNQGYVQMSVNNAVLSTLSITGVANSALIYNWRARGVGFSSPPSIAYTFNSSVAGIWPTGVIGANNMVGGRVVLPNRIAETTTVTNNGLISIANHTIPTDGNYTAAQTSRFNGTVRIFYSRATNWGSGAYWNDANTWSFTSNSGTANTGGAIPGPNDLVYIGYGDTGGGAGPFCCPAGGFPHWTAISTSVTVAGVVFQDRPFSTAWSTAIYIGDNVNANLGAVTNTSTNNSSGQIIYNVGTPANRGNVFGDLGSFNNNEANIIYYILNNGGTVDFQAGQSTYPSVRVEGNSGAGSGTRLFTLPPNNVVVNGNFHVFSRGSVLLFNTTLGANLTIKGNLFLGGNEGDGQVRFPTNGTAKILRVEGNLSYFASTGSTSAYGISVLNSTPSSLIHTFQLGGNFIQNQINSNLNLYNAGATSNNAQLEFINSGVHSYTSSVGNVPNLYKLIINKGIDQSSSFAFLNSVNVLGNSSESIKPVTFSNGTLILSSAGINIDLSSGGGTVLIPATTGLQVENGSQVRMSSVTGIILDGLLRIGDGGIANFNDGVNNTYIEYSSSGNARLEVLGNASLNVGSQIRKNLFSSASTLKYTQTGGNVTVSGLGAATTNAKFELDNAGSSISMTGGNFYIQRGGGGTSFGDLYIDPGTANITGGTFIFSPLSAIGNQSYRIISNPTLNNVQLLSSGASSATGVLLVYPLRVNSDLVVGSTATLNANSFGVESKGNTTIAGAYTAGTNTTSFTGSGLQNLVLNNSIAFNNFLVNKSNILSLTGTNTTVNGLLSITNGTLNDGGLSIFANENVFNSASHQGTGKIVLSGTAAKFVQGNGFGSFTNVEVTSTQEPLFGNEMTINGNLNFISKGIYIDDNALNLGLNASVSGVTSSRYIRTNGVLSDDGVVKHLPASTFDFTFPVGYFGKYTPARYVATSNSSTGSIRVTPVNEAHPLATNPLNLQLNYYWVVTSTGFSGLMVNHSYTYNQADVNGNESLYQAGRNTQGDWAPYYGGFSSSIGGVNATANVISINGLSFINGEYTAGEASELQIVLTYYSRNATLGGNWDDVNTWSTDPILRHTGSVTGFTPFGQPIVINNGHTVLTNGNLREAYSISVSGILDLSTTFGHNFGIIRGAGTIRLAANPSLLFVLPAGQLTSFVSTSTGGTFEFYGANNGDLPAMNPPDLIRFNNVLISGSGTKRINSPTPIYNFGGNLSITGGTLDNVANNNITVSRNWVNTVGVSGFNPGSVSTTYVELNGLNQQVVGQNQFRGLRISGGGTKTFTTNNDVIGQLQLTNGTVEMGSNILSISTSEGSVSGGSSQSFVRGFLQKRFITGSPVTQNFEVGDGGYSPVSISYPSVSTQGNLAVRATAGAHSSANLSCLSTTRRVNRFWTITATSPIVSTNYNATATFLPGDIIGGANTSLFIPSILTGGVWSLPGVGARTSTSTQATAVTYYGDMIVGEPKSAVGVTIVGPAMPVCLGTVLNFTALGINGGTSPGYNWQKDVSGTTTTGLATTQVFTTSTLGNGDIVKVRFNSSDASCTFGNPAFSNGITVSQSASGQWIGAVSTVWTVPGNWCGGIAPTATSDAVINTSPFYPLLTSTTDIRNINVGSGSSMTVNSNFRIAGDFVNNGNFVGTSGSQIQLNGAGNQNISGSSPITTPTLQISAGGTKTLSNTVNVTNTLNISSSTAILASNGNLVLVSNANGTASVSSLSGTAAITGNVRVQNFMGAKINRRYLSFPVQNATISQLQSSIFVNGVGAGFDSPTYIPSVLTYDETQTGQVNIGKVRATSTAQVLQRGVGYEILVRPRTVAPTETRANQTTTAVNLEVVGTLNQGNITIPITFTNTSNATADGYNFVGNPYPANINWTATGWTKTNISPNIYFLDPGSSLTSTTNLAGQAYTFVPGTGCIPAVAGCNSLIAQGQGFYVLATGTGAALGVTEAVKSSGVARRNFRTEETADNLIRVTAVAPNGMLDETIVRVGDSYNDSYESAAADVLKFANSGMNLSTQSKEGYSVVLNSISLTDTLKVVPLVFSSNVSGTYNMTVSETVSLLADAPVVYLRNNVDSSLTEVKNSERVSFVHVTSVTSAPKYSLVMKKSVRTESPTSIQSKLAKNEIAAYPNPFSDGLTLTFTKDMDTDFTVEIVNMIGSVVLSKNYSSLDIKRGKLEIGGLDIPSSSYVLIVRTSSGVYSSIKVAKY